jgi:hypothetical protein
MPKNSTAKATPISDRAKIAIFLRGRATECRAETIELLEGCIADLRDPLGDMEAVEVKLGEALVQLGEARGFVNAGNDIEEREDLG